MATFARSIDMARILTGIQATGVPHLGNILGAILPGIGLSQNPKNEALFFIADMHSLTAIKDPEVLKHNTYSVAAAWMAFDFDTDKNIFYRQSDIPEVTELTWYLSCFAPYPMLANAHSFKDKSDRLHDVNTGLFIYPVLMACDILMYDSNYVPVGKDQKQHLEMTRDLASTFNHRYGETLVMPEAKIDESIMVVPGTDGQKMSKSYGNTINIFENDKKLRKQVMGIETDSLALEEPKNPDTCNVFALYSLLASDEQIALMRKNYLAGGYGYGHAKQELSELLRDRFEGARTKYQHYMENTDLLELELKKGAEKARHIGLGVLERVKKKVGFYHG